MRWCRWQETTGQTPNILMMGREINFPVSWEPLWREGGRDNRVQSAAPAATREGVSTGAAKDQQGDGQTEEAVRQRKGGESLLTRRSSMGGSSKMEKGEIS